MKTRREIKSIARETFQARYWPSVGAFSAVSGTAGLISYLCLFPGLWLGIFTGTISAVMTDTMPYVLLSGYSAGVIALDIAYLILIGPLVIGLRYFYIQLALGRHANVGTPFASAFRGFGRKMGGTLLRALYEFLWGLLFIVPGIIKSFSYAMAPYILADCPNVRAADALKLSRRIMRGKKWRLFVFRLSFIGWIVLSSLTSGVLAYFYYEPYSYSALAIWYLEAREDALRNGTITMAQLEGLEPV